MSGWWSSKGVTSVPVRSPPRSPSGSFPPGHGSSGYYAPDYGQNEGQTTTKVTNASLNIHPGMPLASGHLGRQRSPSSPVSTPTSPNARYPPLSPTGQYDHPPHFPSGHGQHQTLQHGCERQYYPCTSQRSPGRRHTVSGSGRSPSEQPWGALSGYPEVRSVCSCRLVGLEVKASTSREEDAGFESRWRRDFSRVESYQ